MYYSSSLYWIDRNKLLLSKGGLISESFSLWLTSPNKAAKSLSWALCTKRESAQECNLATMYWYLSQCKKKLPDINPPLTSQAHSKSDGAILASRKIAPDREQRSESNFPSNWWSSRLRKWKLSHFTTMELCHCHGCIFFVPLARRRAKKNPVLLEGNQSMVLGSWTTHLSSFSLD